MSGSSTITIDEELLPNPHPGEILAEEFMRPLGLSQNALARSIHVPPRRINELVQGKRAVTADTDLRLARYFGMSEGFFLESSRPTTISWSANARSGLSRGDPAPRRGSRPT